MRSIGYPAGQLSTYSQSQTLQTDRDNSELLGGRTSRFRLFRCWRGVGSVTVAGALATALASLLFAAALPHQASAERTYQKTISSALNSTGRMISMPLPVRDDGRDLGEIVVRISTTDEISLPKAALVTTLNKALGKDALARLDGLPATDGYVQLQTLESAGIALQFDRAQLALTLMPKAEQRPLGEISLARRMPQRPSAAAAMPALMSGYLNVYSSLDQQWPGTHVSEHTSGRMQFESVFRLWNIVVENDFLYDGLVDTYTCPTSAICNYTHTDGFKRHRSRLVYDMPEPELRLQIGDSDANGTSMQRTNDVLGFTLEKSPRKLQPGTDIRASARSALRLDRPSDVEVLVNGAVVQKLRLRAGTYQLSDLPLGTGANDVELRITDDTGQETRRRYTAFFDGTLLAAGKNEWSISAGVPSYFRDNERDYHDGDYLATGFYRQGITDALTGEVHAQADKEVIMGGTGVFAMLPWGIVGAEGAISQSPTGLGVGITLTYDRSNVEGIFTRWTGLKESVHTTADYRSSEFRTPGEYAVTATGILFPQQPYSWRFAASYNVPMPNNITATLSGRYQIADADAFTLSPYIVRGDRYGIDLTVSSPLSPLTTGSITLGYSNETTRPDYYGANLSDKGEARVMARLYYRPTPSSSVSASYDTLNRDAQISGYQSWGQGLDRWETTIDARSNGQDNRGTATASASYWGNRFDARIAHDGAFDGLYGNNGATSSVIQRSSITVGTAIAFADGAVAVGAPVRGQAFAIVEPHPTLAGKTVTVGTDDSVQARSGDLGPALVNDLPAYTNRTLPVDVDGLPLGYSLGQGAFETNAPYRAGYRMTVGSDYSVTAFGTLLKPDGQPLKLISGMAAQAGNSGKQVAVFTNSAGRFGADGLAPGRWMIEMSSDDGTLVYEIAIPTGTDGLFRAGTLKPSTGGVQ